MQDQQQQEREQTNKGDFLLPVWTLPEGHSLSAVVADLFHLLGVANSRRNVSEGRFNALCTLLVGVNSATHHHFRLSQNKNEYSIQQWPIGWRAMMDVQNACIDKGWLLKDTGGYQTTKARRKTTILHAPEGSPLIVDGLFPVAELAWWEPVVQVRSSARKPNRQYISNNIDVEFHANPKNRDFIANHVKPPVEYLNKLSREHDYDLGGYEFEQWARKFRGGFVSAGGRLYAPYQSASKSTRLGWLIDGEPVAELDITACGPTILACLNDQQSLVEGLDPYQILVDNVRYMTRLLAKKICHIAIGNDGLSEKRWPKSLREDKVFSAQIRSIKWKSVREVVVQKLPYLLNPEANTELSLCLQDVESSWLMRVMKELLEHGVGCLPVHESIIVPRSNILLAKEVMARHFSASFGVVPLIDVEISEG